MIRTTIRILRATEVVTLFGFLDLFVGRRLAGGIVAGVLFYRWVRWIQRAHAKRELLTPRADEAEHWYRDRSPQQVAEYAEFRRTHPVGFQGVHYQGDRD